MICFLGGCMGNVSEINPEEIFPDNERLRYGRKLYRTICIKCHRPHDFSQHTDEEWRTIITKKLEKDPLMMSAEETDIIIYFLVYGNSGIPAFVPPDKSNKSFASERKSKR
jgi:hypothetical protein